MDPLTTALLVIVAVEFVAILTASKSYEPWSSLQLVFAGGFIACILLIAPALHPAEVGSETNGKVVLILAAIGAFINLLALAVAVRLDHFGNDRTDE